MPSSNSIVNISDVEELISKDKLFAKIKTLFGLPPNWTRSQGFISLSKIILEQQVSLASAEAHFKKLNNYLPEFSPTEILILTDEEMKACQISRQKAKYLRVLSQAVLSEELDFKELSKLCPVEVKKTYQH
jgi:DNA-3-methyladenine glycosylase II